MNVQYLISKIEEKGISLWDAPGYTVTIKSNDGKSTYKVTSVQVDEHNKNVEIEIKLNE